MSQRPDVILQNGRQANTGLGLPEFTDIAGGVDAIARKIPWWVWLAGGMVLMNYLSKSGKTIKLG
jgi:hypothetical protein